MTINMSLSEKTIVTISVIMSILTLIAGFLAGSDHAFIAGLICGFVIFFLMIELIIVILFHKTKKHLDKGNTINEKEE